VTSASSRPQRRCCTAAKSDMRRHLRSITSLLTVCRLHVLAVCVTQHQERLL
jgi:hypothetical protein